MIEVVYLVQGVSTGQVDDPGFSSHTSSGVTREVVRLPASLRDAILGQD